MGKSHVFVKFPSDEALDSSTTIGDVASKALSDQLIIDLVVKKEKQEDASAVKALPPTDTKPALKDQPLLKKFE